MQTFGFTTLRTIVAVACAIVASTFRAAPARGAADTLESRAVQRPPKDAVDYILAVPSAALKVPFWLLEGVTHGPVVLAEESSVTSTAQRFFAFQAPAGIYPVFGYKARTGLTLGAAFRAKDPMRSGIPLGIMATYSTNTYRYVAARLGDKRLFLSPYGATLEGGWRADTRERFYGIGPRTESADKSNYGFRGMFGSVTGYRGFARRGEISLSAEIRQVEPEDGRLTTIIHERDSMAARYGGQDLYGLFETLTLHDVIATASYDWRKRPSSPLSGGLARFNVGYTFGEGVGDTSIGFWRLHGEFSHFVEVYRERVIGISLTAEHIEPGDGTRVPFYELAKLGGSRLLRGYKSGRFRDLGFVAFAAEYKWPLWRRLDALLLTDHGRVFHDLGKDFKFSNFRSSYGGGFRFWNNAGHLDIVCAKGTEEWSLFMNFGDSF